MSPLYSTQNRSHIREQHEGEWTMTEFSFMPELFLEMINQNMMNCLKDSDKTKTQALHVLARPVKQKHNVRIGSSDIKQILYVSFPLPQKRQICLCLKSCILLLFLRILFRKYKSTSSFLLPPFYPRPVFFFFFSSLFISLQHTSPHRKITNMKWMGTAPKCEWRGRGTAVSSFPGSGRSGEGKPSLDCLSPKQGTRKTGWALPLSVIHPPSLHRHL